MLHVLAGLALTFWKRNEMAALNGLVGQTGAPTSDVQNDKAGRHWHVSQCRGQESKEMKEGVCVCV